VSKFLAGFVSASLLWGGLIYAERTGLISINFGKEPEPVAAVAPEPEESDPEPGKKRPRSKWRSKQRSYKGDSQTGDDLGDPETRELSADQAGGEQQLKSSEIESGFDTAFPKIRRCLMLAASEEPVSGKLMFKLRIASSGQVTAVNLTGPSGVTQSEAGGCMLSAAKSMKFRSFDGPEMLVNYPLTLE
jgi:hypothetical protein